jgi:simple sugar transport system permease protein
MPLGLRIRAAGENPSAAESRGLSVRKLRLGASLIGGAMAGLGGVALAYDQHQFQAGMSGGRGFLAIAIVILARHQPLWTAALCLAFATLDTTQIVLQDRSSIPPAFIQAAPFVVTWLALGRMRAPRSIAAR